MFLAGALAPWPFTNKHNVMPATMQAMPAPFMVYEINPTYAGCEVKYRDIFGQDHTYQITNSEQASLFPEFAHEICYYVEEADNKEF